MGETGVLVWGGKQIAETMGVTERAVFHMLERGHVPGARKIGGRWCLHVPTFMESFTKPQAPTPARIKEDQEVRPFPYRKRRRARIVK